MIADAAWLVAGLLACLAGAEGLIRGAVDLAVRLRVPPLVVGLTVVAWGTSAPEMAVSVRAGLTGEDAVALGNVVGSNIFNIAVILGVAALLHPLRVTVHLLRFDAPVLVGVSLATVGLLAFDGMVSRLDGALLLAGLVAYTLLTIWMQQRSTDADQQAFAGSAPPPRGSRLLSAAFVVGGLGLLVVGASAMVRGATALAADAGIGEGVVGLTLVAAGTSLPELITTAVAARRGQADIAIGNVVGSNLVNILGILGLSSLIAPLSLGGVTVTDLWVMVAAAVVVVPLLWSRMTLHGWEGALLVLGYVGYVGWRWG